MKLVRRSASSSGLAVLVVALACEHSFVVAFAGFVVMLGLGALVRAQPPPAGPGRHASTLDPDAPRPAACGELLPGRHRAPPASASAATTSSGPGASDGLRRLPDAFAGRSPRLTRGCQPASVSHRVRLTRCGRARRPGRRARRRPGRPTGAQVGWRSTIAGQAGSRRRPASPSSSAARRANSRAVSAGDGADPASEPRAASTAPRRQAARDPRLARLASPWPRAPVRGARTGDGDDVDHQQRQAAADAAPRADRPTEDGVPPSASARRSCRCRSRRLAPGGTWSVGGDLGRAGDRRSRSRWWPARSPAGRPGARPAGACTPV